MTAWQLVIHWWLNHDLFFATHFPTIPSFKEFNTDHFGIHWSCVNLWAWVNLHG